MIEELKTLIEAVAEVPTLAMWVAVGYLIYKLFIWGSVVAAILKCFQLGVSAVHANINAKHAQKIAPTQYKFGGMIIENCEAELQAQISRLRGKGSLRHSRYIHDTQVWWLKEAIDAKEKLELESTK